MKSFFLGFIFGACICIAPFLFFCKTLIEETSHECEVNYSWGYYQGVNDVCFSFGKMKNSNFKEKICSECDGKGKVEGLVCKFCNNGKTKDGDNCSACLGTGKRIGICPICGGEGILRIEGKK